MRRFIKIVWVTVALFSVVFIALVALVEFLPADDCTDNVKHHCKAAYTFSNGDIYDGEWVDNKKEGQGTLIAANGQKYIGEFWRGKFDGNGTLITADGATYVGEFKRGKFDGEGTLINKYGTVGKGIWQDNDLYGQGTLTWANGDRYVGDFKDNLINGWGTLTSLDGEKYIGQFKDHQKNGQGTLTAADGTVTEGIWRDNKFQYANLQETDGDHFLSIDGENRILTIHQNKEYEWFSTLFNNLKKAQTNEDANVKIGVYDADMLDITAHANTSSKVIDGKKTVVIKLDDDGFKKFKQMMDKQLSNPKIGYISIYIDHSNKFYSGDFLQ